MAQLDELLRAHEVDVGQRAAGERREAEPEDRADIRLTRIGNDMILHGARSLHRLHHEEPLLQLLDVQRIRIEMLGLQRAQLRPQLLLALALLGIVVEALAVLAAKASALLNHFDQQLLLVLIDRLRADVGFSRLQNFQREVDGDFVVERQRSDRHAGHLADVLDHRRWHAFQQHLVTFADVAQHATIGEEAARVIDDDWRLLDLADVIERGGERHVAGVLADDDFHQHHLLDR